jgi:hypothetical protein
VNSDKEYSEALSSLRHYSNLRFAELSLFSASNGGLAALVYAYSSTGAIPAYVSLLGCSLCLAFIGLEITVHAYIRTFRTYIITHWPESHFASIPRWTFRLTRIVFLVLYAGVFLVWLALPFLPPVR